MYAFYDSKGSNQNFFKIVLLDMLLRQTNASDLTILNSLDTFFSGDG